MLYTTSVSDLKSIKRKMRIYYIIRNHGNDVVVSDQLDLDSYRSGVLTWDGFKINYLAKLYRPEASEWMRRVSMEAVSEDVVLVDEEKDAEYSSRKILAELMVNMFIGHLDLHYMGEITN